MRHPHDLKSASGIIVTRANTPEDVTNPSGNPICTRLPNRPRRPAGRVFDHHQGRAAPFAPEANALDEPQENQKKQGAKD